MSYFTIDDINNLKLCVSVSRLEFNDDSTNKRNIENLTVKWQQKILSKEEQIKVSKEPNENLPYTNLAKEQSTTNFYTMTENDEKTKKIKSPVIQTDFVSELSKMALSSSNRSEEKGNYKFIIVSENFSDEERKIRHLPIINQKKMLIYYQITKEKYSEDVLLIDITYDNGVITFSPDLNSSETPYSFTSRLTKDFYEYHFKIENFTKLQRRSSTNLLEKFKINEFTREKSLLPMENFKMRAIFMGQIESAWNFENASVYVSYFLDLPENFLASKNTKIFGCTQVSESKEVDFDEVSYFSFPLEFDLVYKSKEKDSETRLLQQNWPCIFFEISSINSLNVNRTEGYAWTYLPLTTGYHELNLNSWYPRDGSITSELRRFFIGGDPQLEDPTYSNGINMKQGSKLIRYGFRSSPSGKLKVSFNVIFQSKDYLETVKQEDYRKIQNSGIQMTDINSILNAYHLSRERLKKVRSEYENKFRFIK